MKKHTVQIQLDAGFVTTNSQGDLNKAELAFALLSLIIELSTGLGGQVKVPESKHFQAKTVT